MAGEPILQGALMDALGDFIATVEEACGDFVTTANARSAGDTWTRTVHETCGEQVHQADQGHRMYDLIAAALTHECPPPDAR